jgi:hypothetical protein
MNQLFLLLLLVLVGEAYVLAQNSDDVFGKLRTSYLKTMKYGSNPIHNPFYFPLM